MLHSLDPLALDRLKQGDFKVFEALFNTYWEDLFVYAAKVTESQEDARDIIQDLFTSIWERRSELQVETDIRHYLFSAARKLILRRFRDEGLKEKHLEKFVAFSELRTAAAQIRVENRDLLHRFHKDLQLLPEKERQVFEWYHFDELSIREIAHRSGTAEQTVRNQLNNAYRKAKPLLHRLLMLL